MASSKLSLSDAVSTFGQAATAKLSAVVHGEPEDQLRAPLEALFADLAELCSLDRRRLTLVGETSISDLKTRPDFAASYSGLLVGFIEVKAPGKGADPRRFRDRHDKQQWAKLQALPNLLYTDGQAFSLWRTGQLVGQVVQLSGDVATSGATLTAPDALITLVRDFLSWVPVPPRTPRQLAELTAHLCRLLRDEVAEQLDAGDRRLAGLAKDWRRSLFPDADNAQFADGYAQAVTFGLLLARAQRITLAGGLDAAAKTLTGRHSLIGAALRLVTDDVVRERILPTSVAILGRVLDAVDWATISKGRPEAWLYFYEEFLAEYDNTLRKRTGSYYTPVEVVRSMTRLVDDALSSRFGLSAGLADPSVTVADPATGTGTFLLETVRAVAAKIEADVGGGAIGEGIKDYLRRLIGFELQLGPYAVAQLRLLAELAALGVDDVKPDALRLYVTNTLANPYIEEEMLGTWYEPIAESRRSANKIKRDEPILVVIGNPPYKEKSHGRGGWIESGSDGGSEIPLEDFLPDPSWGLARTSSTCTTRMSTSGAGRPGRSSTTTLQPTGVSSASSRSPDSWTDPDSNGCATTYAAARTPSG